MGDECAICGEELAIVTEDNPGFILFRFDLKKGQGLLGQFCNVEHLAEFVRTALEFLRDEKARTHACLSEIFSTYFPEERTDEAVKLLEENAEEYGRYVAKILLTKIKKGGD